MLIHSRSVASPSGGLGSRGPADFDPVEDVAVAIVIGELN